MSQPPTPTGEGEILLYQTEDGQTRVEVHLSQETVWLSQKQMADLFQKDVRTINEHIRNLFEEGELLPEATIRNFRIVQNEGQRQINREVAHYNLDVVISVGYRVKSHRGVQFRIWATQRLKDYIIKGFVLDDERFKQGRGGNYFDELLARIRDIRSSEKEFWRKVLDIYATSIDYDPDAKASHTFFATIQNKMHWAAHGHTAAEVIHTRASASKPHMGLTNFPTGQLEPRKADVVIAKNYLTPDELEILNRTVNAYLEFAELQALNRKPMYMADWVAKLDQFLQLGDREILTHAGKISAEAAKHKAEQEYTQFRKHVDAEPSLAEIHFQSALKHSKQLEQAKKDSHPKKREKP